MHVTTDAEPKEVTTMAATPPPLAQDTLAIDFRLPCTDGRIYALEDIAGKSGTVIVFICNHCPYVKAVIDRLVTDARTLMAEGVGFAAICSNDADAYPEDSFEAMQRFAQARALPFPYLHDEDQSVARAYGAVCTPDFFGYDANRRLKYRRRAPGVGRGHPSHCGDRHSAVRADAIDRLFHQMEAGGMKWAGDRVATPALPARRC
jgi:peroxiredoxin